MTIYKVLFRPLEEYFFGKDGSFSAGVGDAEYFITSHLFPSQTTLFGIMRYLNLRHLKDRGTYSEQEKEENVKAIGKKSFCMETAIKPENGNKEQDFGIIKAISGVFLHEHDLQNKVSRIYLPLPKDAKEQEDSRGYESIFTEGEDIIIDTLYGKKIIPKEYDAKKGLRHGFISTDAGITDTGKQLHGELKIIDSPFEYVLKTGLRINQKKQLEGNEKIGLDMTKEPMSSLFKKEYIRLKSEMGQREYSFGIYVKIEDNKKVKTLNRLNRIVGMGLGSSLFKVEIKEVQGEESNRLHDDLVLKVDKIFENHPQKEKMVYCISPCYTENLQNLLDKSQFSSIEIIANRPMSSGSIDTTWRKEETLYRMLDAGSVLVAEDLSQVIETFDKKGLQQIGYNHYYIGGKK